MSRMNLDNLAQPKPLEPPQSISDQIYEHLKQKILCGDIEPGERLMQIQVAETLKISRTPVREAICRLEQDGLVERLPQGGVIVSPVDRRTIKEVFGIRGVLEAYAVGLACDRIMPEEISMLRKLMDQAMQMLNSKEINRETKLKGMFELNCRFHDTIYQATGNSYLLNLIRDLRDIVRRLRYLGLRADHTWTQVWEEHGQLINLLELRDKESAIELIKKHLVNAATYVEFALKATTDSDKPDSCREAKGHNKDRDTLIPQVPRL